MIARISVVSAVLVLAVFATGCTKNGETAGTAAAVAADNSSAVDQTFSGSSFTVDVDSTTGHSKTLHHLNAKGQSGNADVDAMLVFETHGQDAVTSPGKDERCPDAKPDIYPYGANLVSLTWIQSYNDGSAFTGGVDLELFPDPESKPVVCTDGARFYIKVNGRITGGAGPRFRNVSGGTWQVEAQVDEYSHTTGTVRADFTY
jgi:hypothetical protein